MKKKINLHIIIYSHFPSHSGGRENWLYNLLPFFSKKFENIFIYSLSSKGPKFYNLNKINNIKLIKLFSCKILGFFYKAINLITFNLLIYFDMFVIFRIEVRKHLKKYLHKNDVVIAMNSIIELSPAIDLKINDNDFLLICSVHGLVPKELETLFPLPKSYFNNKEKYFLDYCDKIFTNGYDTKKYISNIGFNSIIIPNGVDTELFSNSPPKDEVENINPVKEKNLKIIMMIASLRKIKGTLDVINTAKVLKENRFEEFRILLIGKGNINYYKKKAIDLEVEENILFLGEKKNIPAYLNLADIVLCLFGGGGMPLSTLEAMASGKPIIAWDTPMFQQLIDNNVNGFLVEYKNYYELSNKIIELLNNDELVERFSRKIKLKAKKFDWKYTAQKIIKEINI